MIIAPLTVHAIVHSDYDDTSEKVPALRCEMDYNQACVTVWDDTVQDKDKQRYRFSTLSTSRGQTALYRKEVDATVEMAMSGYNAAIILMSMGKDYVHQQRLETVRYLLTKLDNALDDKNKKWEQQQGRRIVIDYVWLEMDDDTCCDISRQRTMKNGHAIASGTDRLMLRVNKAQIIYNHIKPESNMPQILRIRLSDDTAFLANIMLADMRPVRFRSMMDEINVHQSFTVLQHALRQMIDPPLANELEVGKSVLANELLEYVCGRHKTTAIIHLQQYPTDSKADILEVLDFSRMLAHISCVSVRNKADMRTEYYKAHLNLSKQHYREQRALYVHLQKSLLKEQLKNSKVTSPMDKSTQTPAEVLDANENSIDYTNMSYATFQKTLQEHDALRAKLRLSIFQKQIALTKTSTTVKQVLAENQRRIESINSIIAKHQDQRCSTTGHQEPFNKVRQVDSLRSCSWTILIGFINALPVVPNNSFYEIYKH
ncbi:uncharacterized protein BYT42DRAFT_556280 [Radiomyces spectabilis]|uniref:uncharacterized protein n=1 Tax=Radiomyces spectabilis TaxID=64574 RepID=UPI00221E5790|nr:uncharacterized protein BYT42DRAFT_556280 [Radiomyces spectabilis]KAI8391275.1 hypothetical protein BYT42DRAFT_556280 [Radiomyces spectabilis]